MCVCVCVCVCVWRGLKVSARPSTYSFTSVDWEADGRELDGPPIAGLLFRSLAEVSVLYF